MSKLSSMVDDRKTKVLNSDGQHVKGHVDDSARHLGRYRIHTVAARVRTVGWVLSRARPTPCPPVVKWGPVAGGAMYGKLDALHCSVVPRSRPRGTIENGLVNSRAFLPPVLVRIHLPAQACKYQSSAPLTWHAAVPGTMAASATSSWVCDPSLSPPFPLRI